MCRSAERPAAAQNGWRRVEETEGAAKFRFVPMALPMAAMLLPPVAEACSCEFCSVCTRTCSALPARRQRHPIPMLITPVSEFHILACEHI